MKHRAGVSANPLESISHIDVTENLGPDTIARLVHFPNIQSVKVSLGLVCHPLFQYKLDCEGYGRPATRPGLMELSPHLLEATFSIKQLQFLTLDLACGDSLCHLPWENLPELCELHVSLDKRVAQGSFAFLPRVATLKVLHANLDFFSVRCLRFLTRLVSLDMSVAPPEGGYLGTDQVRDRNDKALLQIARLPQLEILHLLQPASKFAIARLAALSKLTELHMRLPRDSHTAVLSPWEVVRLFQQDTFRLQFLHFEFNLGVESGLATMFSPASPHAHRASKCTSELQFSVPWSVHPIIVRPLRDSS